MDEYEIYPASLEALCRSLNVERSISQKERDAIDDSDFAGPHNSFPIDTQEHLDAAAKLIGHADDEAAVKAKAIAIAKKKGFKLPDSWQEDDKQDDSKERAVAPVSMYAPITRIDKDEWLIEGQATSDAVDLYGTVFDYESSKKAFATWRGNIREMHQNKAVGRAIEVIPDDVNRCIMLRARISKGARDTWEKIVDGTLSGFSISVPPGRYKTKNVVRNGKSVPMYYDHDLAEVSVVDNPGSPNCDIAIVRADGMTTETLDVTEEPPVPEEKPVERAGTRVSSDTKSKMHSSIAHTLHAAASQMQNCGCDDCNAAMKLIDPDNDGDIDLGGYDDPDNDWQSLYGDNASQDMERTIVGIVERALMPVYARLQGIAGTLARANTPTNTNIETLLSGAITRAIDAANSANESHLATVRAELSAVKETVDRIDKTPLPGAPIMNSSATQPRSINKTLSTDPYQAPQRSGSSVYDAIARMSESGQLDTPERQADAIAAGFMAQQRIGR